MPPAWHSAPPLARRLAAEVEGEVLWQSFDRARYATDASIYQIEPRVVLCPRDETDIEAALAIAAEDSLSVTPRGAGTSQAGQTLGRGLVIDTSRHLTGMGEVEDGTIWVEPGLVLDELNRRLKPSGLFYPVDVSTASRATLGGMTANNSCGSRSLRYGVSVDNVLAIEALLADGRRVHFGPGANDPVVSAASRVARSHALEIGRRFPKTARHVGGYNLDRLLGPDANPASLLVGSEGTLAWLSRIKLKLHRIPPAKCLGICHFPTFRAAMEATRHIVGLDPTAVELVDGTILALARSIPSFADILPRFVRGRPASLLLVEFTGETDPSPNLTDLATLMADLGYPDAVESVTDVASQSEIWGLRAAGLNIAMSMKGDGKPVSFVEDCAVPLEHLAGYTEKLDEVFARHGTSATWYAHASVGCLHVRPILNLKLESGVRAMRAIAEEAIELVQRYKGAFSGEHGDGLVRSSHNPRLFGPHLTGAFEQIKDLFDPHGLFNADPPKIVRAPEMDDRSLMRFSPGYAEAELRPGLDWSAWGSALQAAEMCNNNGECRKMAGGVMCPSFRVTRDERHVTRGRANVLRQALSGQLGAHALVSAQMAEALELCVGCKACKRECPTGVDMARLKIEHAHQTRMHRGLPLKKRILGHLPRWAPFARFFPVLDTHPRRSLPRFRRGAVIARPPEPRSMLFIDCFNRWIEPENAHAAARVLGHLLPEDATPEGERPLCCGRTYLSAGMLEEARSEMRRLVHAVSDRVERGMPLVGLEPSCLLTLRDELPVVLTDENTEPVSRAATMFADAVLASPPSLGPVRGGTRKILVHGHCHEKAFGVAESTVEALRLIPGIEARMIESSCCGMAGSFGYESRHIETSFAMAELSLLPAVRAAPDAGLVANGTSCRHQIADGTGREALHLARMLDEALTVA